LLINPFTEIPSFFLIERQGYDGPHSGQIGLPGGKKEATDADFWHTAIRETTEELGISADSIEPLGMLTELFIPVSRFWVFPKIGILKNEVALSPDAREVKRVIAPFIGEVLKEENRARRSVSAGGFQLEAPVFIFNDIQVWGATAMILSEFSEVLKQSDLIRYYS
jgi:8-oxo-dGTP pyrophosphatase MutT (NUDIX family)